MWPTETAPDDRWWWMWRSRWNGWRKPKYSEKNSTSATLSTANPIWPDPGWNLGHLRVKPATNCLSYGTALPPRSNSVKIVKAIYLLNLRFEVTTALVVQVIAPFCSLVSGSHVCRNNLPPPLGLNIPKNRSRGDRVKGHRLASSWSSHRWCMKLSSLSLVTSTLLFLFRAGKWFNYGIIVLVMLLDLNMWKNQIFYNPKDFGQYTGINKWMSARNTHCFIPMHW
jgi:hypothetical protein